MPEPIRMRLSATPATLDRVIDRLAPLFTGFEISEYYPNIRYPETGRIYLTGCLCPDPPREPHTGLTP